MKTRRPSPMECTVLIAVQEAIEDLLDNTNECLIKDTDDSRVKLAMAVLDRLRGQGIHNEELPWQEFRCGPYGRLGRRRYQRSRQR